MNPTPIIRPRTEADLPALAAILVRVHAVDGYPVEGVSDPEAWLQHPDELGTWIAALNGRPVGQITLVRANDGDAAARVWRDTTGGQVTDLALIVRLFVDAAARGTGAAFLLMDTAIDHARSLGLAVALDVMSKDRAAIRLYQRHGARLLGDISHEYNDNKTQSAQVYEIPTSPRPGAIDRTRSTPIASAVIYKITYPNGKIYVGQDRTNTLTYFGSPGPHVRADFTPDECRDFTARKQILWEAHDATRGEVNAAERRFILALQSNNPEVGYNRWPAWRQP